MLRPARFLGCFAASALLAGNSRAATLYGFATGTSVEAKWTTGLDLAYSDGSVRFVSRTLSRTDPAAAAAYVTSMPESSGRDSIIGIYVLSVSLGSYGSNNDTLRQAIESALIFSGSGVIDAGRGRGRETLAPGTSPGTLSTGTLLVNGSLGGSLTTVGDGTLSLDWSLYSEIDGVTFFESSSDWQTFGPGVLPVVAIPEPSSALLIGLGSLRLLVRRRRTS